MSADVSPVHARSTPLPQEAATALLAEKLELFQGYSTELKEVQVVSGTHLPQTMMPIMVVNLARLAFRASVDTFGTSLSKPSFDPSGSGRFICGTDDPIRADRGQRSNSLILSKIDEKILHPHAAKGSDAVVWTCPINDCVRDIEWIDSQRVVLALNTKLALLDLEPTAEFKVREIVVFPEFHRGTIREIALSRTNRHLVLSGGFDGNVFVTDVVRLFHDIRQSHHKTENSIYPCKGVVGSVRWHPYDANLASSTVDTGIFHMFDIRTDRKRPSLTYDIRTNELFTHAYRDPFLVLMGFGNGELQVHDIRKCQMVSSFQDQYQLQIGDIQMHHQFSRFSVLGNPDFTLWTTDRTSIRFGSAQQFHTSPPAGYKTAGSFLAESDLFAVTDSAGIFAVYDTASVQPDVSRPS
eukprot:GILK01013676.1.p1 GENE.GILK01013676.1~~GILK01013676.1.p1  ORF type:complete len:444 (+),score=42.87 GILK01013676.1:105-1334(+)